jgi:hypothetical protein
LANPLPFQLQRQTHSNSRLTSRDPIIYDIYNMKGSTTGSGGGSNENGQCDTSPQAAENLP